MSKENKISLLRKEREQRGWSRAYVAEKTESDPRTVGRWERGESFPNPYYRQKLCELFGMPPKELGLLPENFADRAEQTSPRSSPDKSISLDTSQSSDEKEDLTVDSSVITPPPLPGTVASMQTPHRATPHKYARFWRIAEMSIAVLIVAGLILTFLELRSRLFTSTSVHIASANVGTISFTSSGDFGGNSNQGMNDIVNIHISSVPTPPPDKSYYAWLAGDTVDSETDWMLLGKLNFSSGVASLSYPDPQHTNLLAKYSHFLITEGDKNIPPLQPSSDPGTWLYTAYIPQVRAPGDSNHYSLLDHLRHLLATDPTLHELGIQGGLDYWLYNHTKQVLDMAKSLNADWQANNRYDLHKQIIRILDYLDGSSQVQKDVPSGTPLLVKNPFAQIGLLYGTPQQEPPGYLDHIDIHVVGVSDSPGATLYQQGLARQIQNAINDVEFWLKNVLQDAKQLIQMNDQQLSQPSTLSHIQMLEQQAQYAYYGQNVSSGNLLEGVSWIYTSIQQLAMFDWQRYSASHS